MAIKTTVIAISIEIIAKNIAVFLVNESAKKVNNVVNRPPIKLASIGTRKAVAIVPKIGSKTGNGIVLNPYIKKPNITGVPLRSTACNG